MSAPSNMSPDWIARTIRENPTVDLGGGNYRTCPIRTSFPHLSKPQKAMEAGKADKYAVTALFQTADPLSLLKQGAFKACQEKWGDQINAYMQQSNFHVPWKDQADKVQYEGYVPGLPCFTATGERQPPVVMQNTAPYTGRIFPGQWAMLIVRPFAFATTNEKGAVLKRGCGFGLQSVMIICDDMEFGEGGIDVQKAFAGVSIEAGVNPSDAFNGGFGAPAQQAAVNIFS